MNDAKTVLADALDAVARGAGSEWVEGAYDYLARYCAQHQRFLIDDVRSAAQRDGLAEPHDARAWGVVARMAVQANLMRADGFAPVSRVSAHMRPMRVWESLLLQEQI